MSDAARDDAALRATNLEALAIAGRLKQELALADRMQREFALADRVQRDLALVDRLRREVVAVAETARAIPSRVFDTSIAALEPFHPTGAANSYEIVRRLAEARESLWNQYLGVDKTVMGINTGFDSYVATISENLTGVAAGLNQDVTVIARTINEVTSPWNHYITGTMAEAGLRVNQFGQQPHGTIAEALQPFIWPPEWLRTIIEQGTDDLFSELELYLIDEGWYLSIELPAGIVFEVADLQDEENFEGIEEALRDFFRARLAMVEALIVSEFPKRKRILEQTFRAHRAGDYALSVPVFLAQADGISAEVLRANFFRPSKVTRTINKLLKQRDVALSPTVLRHLSQLGSLRESFACGKRPAGFNRHNILHGASIDYDTEANSLRGIALLEFLVSLRPVFGEANSEILTVTR